MRFHLWALIPVLVTMFASSASPRDLPVSSAPAPAQKMKQQTGWWSCPAKGGQARQPYIAFMPPSWDGKQKIPLLIFLHGAGYRGNDISKIDRDEVLQIIREGRVFDAVVFCPQSPSYWTGEQGGAAIDAALKDFEGRFDPDRVYLTGESAGGGGAWEGGKLKAKLLAAIVPIATAIGRPEGAENLVGVPVWAFHNRNDPSQDFTKTTIQIDAIRAAGGKYAFYTEYTETPGKEVNGKYPNAHRQAWEAAYRYEPMWEWLFRQRRGKPELALTPPPEAPPGVRMQ